MKPHPKTLALVALAAGMVVSAYLIGPAPASTAATAVATPRAPQVASVASASASPTIKTLRPPVPLSVSAHKDFFTAPPADAAAPTSMIDTAKGQISTDDAASPAEMAAAKSAIEMDGYRKVANLVKAADGSWRGRALRGSTEIAVRVDATGSVVAD